MLNRVFTISVVCLLITACGGAPKRRGYERGSEPKGELDKGLEGNRGVTLQRVANSLDTFQLESLDRSAGKKALKGSSRRKAAALCIQGKTTEGLGEIRRLSRDKPSASGWTTLGNCYVRHNKWKLAILHFNHALSLKPRLVAAINGLAVSKEAIGATAEARVLWERALKLNSRSRVVRWNLARLYMKNAQYRLALPHLKVLLKYNAADPWIQKGLAISYHARGNMKDAGIYYNQLGSSAPDDPEYLINYASFQLAKGDRAGALDSAKRALEILEDQRKPWPGYTKIAKELVSRLDRE